MPRRPPYRSYGWTHDGEVIPAEADQLRWMANRVLDGASLRAVARELDEAGVESAMGKSWGARTVKAALVSERMVGAEGWPPILDRDVWDAVGEVLAGSPRAQRVVPRSWLIGVAVCSVCGAVMPQQGEYLRCPCGETNMRVSPIEADAEARIVGRLASPRSREVLARRVAEIDADAADAEIEDAEARIEVLSRVFGRGESHQAAFELGVAEAQKQIEDALARLAARRVAHDLPAPDTTAVVEWWEGLPGDARREVAGWLLKAVVVSPRTPGADRLHYRWR